MLRLLGYNWLNRRLARAIPNPYVRAAAIAGGGLLMSRMAQGRRPTATSTSVTRRRPASGPFGRMFAR